MMNENVTFGVGGYLADHPNGNVAERLVDNGDGTGTRTVYAEDGTVAEVENLTGLPIADIPEADTLAALKDAVVAKMSDPAVNSIARVKAAVIAAFDEAL